MINTDARRSRLSLNLTDPNGHVTLNQFGLNPPEGGEYDKLVLTLDAVRPITAELLSRKAYHIDHGICDHDRPDAHPLDMVRMHPKENIIEGGPRQTYIRKFVNYGLSEIYNISVNEYMDMPYPDVVFMLELAESTRLSKRGESNEVDRVLRSLTAGQ